jgi:sRNA-binding protein
MSLDTSRTQLHEALKVMRQRWDEVYPLWNDATRRDFVENHWRPLEAQVVAVLKHMDHLSQVMSTLRQEVGRRATL